MPSLWSWRAGLVSVVDHRLDEGLVASRHVGSSQPRDQTCVPFISRQTLSHWATRGAPHSFLHIFVQRPMDALSANPDSPPPHQICYFPGKGHYHGPGSLTWTLPVTAGHCSSLTHQAYLFLLQVRKVCSLSPQLHCLPPTWTASSAAQAAVLLVLGHFISCSYPPPSTHHPAARRGWRVQRGPRAALLTSPRWQAVFSVTPRAPPSAASSQTPTETSLPSEQSP